ncbi:MAG: hypothetical protein JJU32_01300 [Phormidium sp. BM_Day4_Bin.17]|nr:hypothetical protein [Phormidium sp. BM_Day4_Bin.17]UCJ12431.1 MAG: hypothetical protein JWS08_00960 [Phormidium sp. PBR-2020]
MSTSPQLPQYVSDLIALYGQDYGNLLGSAVFYDILDPDADLEQVALRHQRDFVGPKWFTSKQEDWLGGWILLYRRPIGQVSNIVKEFEAVYDIYEKILENFLEPLNSGDHSIACQKLAIAFDDPDVTDLRIYEMHDQDILTGRLVIGRRSNGETTTLVIVCD